jgi:hypothetical protein
MVNNQRVTSLISEYNKNPHLFNDDQLDELEELADLGGIEFTRKHDDFSLFRAIGQLGSGFAEGLTTLPVGSKPVNTYERIAHSLGHLAGFAPSIMTAPAKYLAKKAGAYGLARTAKAFKGIEKSGAVLDKFSLPMIGSRWSKRGVDNLLERTGLETKDYLMKGAKTRAIMEEAVGLGTASTISGIWEGPDTYMNTFVGGAIAGGAFGTIGNFASIGHRLKGTPEQAKRAEDILKTSLGATVQGLPAYLRDEPIEMILYETLLGGFFGYKSRPAHEAEGGKFIDDLKYSNNPAHIFKPQEAPNFEKYTPKAQEYINNQATDNAINWAKGQGVPKQELDVLARNYLSTVEPNRTPTSFTQQELSDTYKHIAYEIHHSKNPFTGPESDINSPDLHESKFEYRDDWTEGIDLDMQTRNLINSLADKYQKQGKEVKGFTFEDAKVEISNSYKDGSKGAVDFIRSFNGTKMQDFVKENQQAFINYYQKRRNGIQREVYAVDIDKKGRIVLDSIHGDYFGKSIGDNYLNMPSDYLMPNAEFKLITHARKDNEVKDIFGINLKEGSSVPMMNNISKRELSYQLDKNNQYLFSGLKDNGQGIVAKYHPDAIPNNLNNIINALGIPRSTYEAHRQHYLDSLNIKNPNKFHELNHQKMWMSNVLHMAEANNFHVAGEMVAPNKFSKLMDSSYGKNVIDFNKRTQLIANRFFPQNKADYADIKPDGMLKYIVLKDNKIYNNDITNSATDGSGLLRQTLHDRSIIVNGIPKNATFQKPVFATKGKHGMHYMKLAGERANNVWQEFMDTHGIDAVFFESATKHLGDYQPLTYKYKDGKIESNIPDASKLDMPIEHWRISNGTVENVGKSVKGDHSIVTQMSTNLSDLQTPNAINRFFKEVVEKSAEGFDPFIREMTEGKDWVNDKNLYTMLSGKDGESVLKNIPARKIVELHTKHRESDLTELVRKIISRTDLQREIDGSIEHGGAEWKHYHERSKRILRLMNNDFTSSHLFKPSKESYENQLAKYIMQRYVRPNWKYSAKGIFGSVTEDVFHGADRLQRVKLGKKFPKLRSDQIMLGNAFRNMPIKPIVYKGKEITTLGKAFDIYKQAKTRKINFKEKIPQELKDALEVVIVRVPMDSVSGARVVRLEGFLKDGGTKVVTHNKQDRYMGGADKDIDSMFIYQGFSKKLKNDYRKLENEWENVNDKDTQFDSIFGTTSPEFKDVSSKFSPSMRWQVGETAKKGNVTLGYGISQKSFMTNLMDLIHKGGAWGKEGQLSPTVTIKHKNGNIKNKAKAVITLKDKDSPALLRTLGREIVNRSADSSDYSHFNNMEKITSEIFDRVFKVEFKGEDAHIFEKMAEEGGALSVIKKDSLFKELGRVIDHKPYTYKKNTFTKKNESISLKYWEIAEILNNRVIPDNPHIKFRIADKLKKDGFIRDIVEAEQFLDIDPFLASIEKSLKPNDLSVKDWILQGYGKPDSSNFMKAKFISKLKAKKGFFESYDYGQMVNEVNLQLVQLASYNKLMESAIKYRNRMVAKHGKKKGDKLARERVEDVQFRAQQIRQEYALTDRDAMPSQKRKDIQRIKDGIADLKSGKKRELQDFIDYIFLSPNAFRSRDTESGHKKGTRKTEGKENYLLIDNLFYETNAIADGSIKGIVKEVGRIFDIYDKQYSPEKTSYDVSEVFKKHKLVKGKIQEKKVVDAHQEAMDKLLGADPITSKAVSKEEFKILSGLRDKFKIHFNDKADLENYFTFWTSETGGIGKTLETANIGDFLAFNNFLTSLKNPTEAFKFQRRMYYRTPMGESERQMQHDLIKFESVHKPVLTSEGVKNQPIFQYTSSLGALRNWLNNAEAGGTKSLNAYLAKGELNNKDRFKYREDLTVGQHDRITHLVHNIRESKLHEKEYDVTKDKLFKELPNTMKVDGKSYTKKGLIEKVDKDFTKFFKEHHAKWINDGKTDKWLTKDSEGNIDINAFMKKYINPSFNKSGLEVIPFDVLKRVRFEMVIKDLSRRKDIKPTKLKSIITKLRKNYQDTGKFEFDKYFMHTNFGYNSKARKQISSFIDKEVTKVYQEALSKGKTEKQALKMANARKEFLENAIEGTKGESYGTDDMLFESLAFDKLSPTQLMNKLDHVGFTSSPNTAKSREVNLQGYDTRSSVLDKYKKQWITSNYRAQASIMAHYRLFNLLSRKPFDKGVKLTKKQLEHYTKAGYSKEAPITEAVADYLRFYIRDSFGHHSLFEERVANSMSTTDPLKLKKNLYYLTSDQALINGMERLRTKLEDYGYDMPFMKDMPKGAEARKKYYARMFRNIGTAEARFQLLSLLSNTGTMTANLFGGTSMTIASAGFRNWIKAQDKKHLFNEVLKDTTLKLEDGSTVKDMKQLRKWVAEKGVIDTYIKNELEVNPSLKNSLEGKLEAFKSFAKDYSKLIKQNPDARDETVLELANRYGVKDAIIKAGAIPMSVSERYLRFNSYMAHALKAREIFGADLKLDDPFITEYAMKGIEATQFLYSAPNRPAFMRTSLGKVLGRFKTFAFNSVRTRKELYKQAKFYGFKEGTESFNKFKDLFIIDMFTMALGSMFAYSLFDTALPPPWDWLQETSQWLFGNKQERDKAFFAQYPYPIAPLQIITPPVARIPMSTFSALLNNDWDRFMDYHIHTMYPFGRVVRQIDQTFDEPYGTTFGRGMQQFFRLPTDKLVSKYKKSQLEDMRKEYIQEVLNG